MLRGEEIMKKGKLFGVSTGPGEPELMTLKALRVINGCSVVFVPRTRGENMLALSIAEKECDLRDKEIIPLDFPMTGREEYRAAHVSASEKIIEYLDKGTDCAMLCLGDISVYSTFSYTYDLLADKGYEIVIIPGVTSFCAAAAAAGEPLVSGNEPLIIMPPTAENFDDLLSEKGTKVIMKSGKRLCEIKEKIKDRKVTAVSCCGLDNERIFSSAEDIPDDSGYFTVITVK